MLTPFRTIWIFATTSLGMDKEQQYSTLVQVVLWVQISNVQSICFTNLNILLKKSLEYRQTYAGQKVAIPDLQDTHHDIVGISIEKLVNCTKAYQTVIEMDPKGETYIIRYVAGEIKDLQKSIGQ